ncbi:MAG: hypothetical protein KJO43_04110, partial [Phycisphaerae bacterium]|nr:hypothetical protein [Phycisphaerae bacterium]
MTSPSPIRLRLALPLIAALVMPSPILVAEEGEQDVQRWAMDVWNAARRGDAASVEARMSRLPAPALDSEAADRFRSSVDAMKVNRERAAASQREARAEAIDEMRTERDADNLAAALRKAVTAQTLSDDLDSAFGEPEIMELVKWAKAQLPQADRDRLWLDSQEIMYLLRTFYEDTSRQDQFQYFDDQLEQVNRRVGLLARYAPRKLHEMRNERATRLGEEPYGDFNPATSIDWRERLEGVDHHMLKAALQTAAAEHVETKGWRDLMSGGLASLKIFATTTPLSEAFPTLADANRVNRWTNALDGEVAALGQMPDRELDRWAFSSQLDRLVRLNRETLDVPIEVILREYGDGAMHELDTYSEIIWPEKLRRFQQATAGNFVGIGILIRHNDKREIMVVNPLEGTPAYFQGVKLNDLIMT